MTLLEQTVKLREALTAKSCTDRAYVGAEECGRYPCARCRAVEALDMLAASLRENENPRHDWRGNLQPAGAPAEWRCTMCDHRVPMTTPLEALEVTGCITWDEAAIAPPRPKRRRAR